MNLRTSLTAGFLAAVVVALLLATPWIVRAEPDFRIVVRKSEQRLVLFRDGETVRNYRVSLGREPRGPKRRRGDLRTPVGTYAVAEKKADSSFHRFLGINYPNVDDADHALEQGWITVDEWADIWWDFNRGKMPRSDTALGGRIGIHGTAKEGTGGRLREQLNWTDGCIALTDTHAEELFEIVPLGTPVEIVE